MERFPIEAGFEVRARADGKGRTIVGYAAVFDRLSEDLGGFKEKIERGAFKETLKRDILALWNHNQDMVLGRSGAGTLRLQEDERGLRVEIDPPVSAAGLVESIERGDVTQMSFGFHVERDTWANVAGQTVRTLTQVRLREVSAVPFGAYPDTEVSVRALFGDLPEIPESYRRAPVENEGQPARARGAAPIEVRSDKGDRTMNVIEMQRAAAQCLADARRLDSQANAENRMLSEEERGAYDLAIAEHRRLSEASKRAEELAAVNATPVDDGAEERSAKGVPNILRHYKRGDTEERALGAYLRRGDPGGLLNLRASNDTSMNITTAADGGYAVPTGHYGQIIAKRDESLLAPKLGCRRIPGKGTTVNVPVDAGTANVAVLTAEENAGGYDRDAPVLAQVAMTLVKYTKQVDITEELDEDNDSSLLAFIEDYVGRAFAQTQNTLLAAAAVAAGGGTTTALVGAGATALPADITTLVYTLKDQYADNAKWLMRRTTEGAYRALTGSAFQFSPTPGGSGHTLWQYPVFNSAFVAAGPALNAKCLLFGDWNFMGWREGAGLSVLRDPYSVDGSVILKYSQRVVYKVLIPEAILVGQKAAA